MCGSVLPRVVLRVFRRFFPGSAVAHRQSVFRPPSPAARLPPRSETSSLLHRQSAARRALSPRILRWAHAAPTWLSVRVRWAGATSSQRPGRMCSDRSRSAASFSSAILHQRRLPQNHDRPIVHRVIENRAGEHQSIEQSYGDADRYAIFHLPQACGSRPSRECRDSHPCGRRRSESRTVGRRRAKPTWQRNPSSRMRYTVSRS